MRMCPLVLLIVTAYVVSAVPVEDFYKEDEIIRSSGDVEYQLYTRRNPQVSQTLVMADTASIINSEFNGRVSTAVIVHGWLSKHDANMSPTIRDAFLAKDDVNIIVVNWRRLALADYTTAARAVPEVGFNLGNFIALLNRITGAQFNSIHLIGIGLGAHLVGIAGKQLGGRAARITGLDPAGALFTSSSNSISSGDAIYVEAIHTDGGTGGVGIGSAVADADFFPNGGKSQPGCVTSLCNHNRAWELFASTVTNNHLVGRRCLTTAQFLWNACTGLRLNMGNDILTKSGSGTYRLSTGRRYPY